MSSGGWGKIEGILSPMESQWFNSPFPLHFLPLPSKWSPGHIDFSFETLKIRPLLICPAEAHTIPPCTGRSATCIYWVEAKGAAKHSAMHRMTPHNKKIIWHKMSIPDLALRASNLCTQQGPALKKGLIFGLMLCCCHVEILSNFWTKELSIFIFH